MEHDADSRSGTPTKVMFDGACPLCRSEISLYRQLHAKEAIDWIDVSACAFQPPAGTTKARLLRRFHLITPEGRLLSGAAAFVFLWNRLPRWLGMMSRLPGMMFLMEQLYRGFLVVRPALQRIVRFLAVKR